MFYFPDLLEKRVFGGLKVSLQGDPLRLLFHHNPCEVPVNIWLLSLQRFFREGLEYRLLKSEARRNFERRVHLAFGGGAVVLAVSREVPFGVSLQPLDQIPPPEVLPTILSPREFQALVRRHLLGNLEEIIKIWTAKEAFLDLLGYKFALPLSRLELTLSPFRVKPSNDQAEELHLKHVKLYLGQRPFLLALVSPKEYWQKPFFCMNLWRPKPS